MMYSAINCFPIHMYVYRDFYIKINMFVYDEMILSFNYTILGSYWLIDYS